MLFSKMGGIVSGLCKMILNNNMRIKLILVCAIILTVCLYGYKNAVAFQAETEKIDLLNHKEQVVHLNLQNLVQEVVKRNASAINDYIETQMSKERVKAEEGIFEPVFQSSFNKTRTHLPNTAEDLSTRGWEKEYYEDVNMFDLGLGGRVSSGATWDLKFIDRQRSSSTIERLRNYEYEYDNSIKLSLEQPLLKGFGKDITCAKIDLAKIESKIDKKKFDQKAMELVAVTAQLYWKLYGAQKISGSWEKSLAIAENSIKDIEARAMGGKIAYTELMEAQSAVSILRSESYNAKSKAIEVQNQLFTLLNVSASEYKNIRLIAIDDPFGNYEHIVDCDEYVRMALEKWPEYEIAEKKVEKEKIQVKYARNQVLPQLDIVGSVGLNSLDQEYEESLRDVADDEFFSWSAGIKFSIPVFDNAQAKSSLSIARMRVRQAEVELDALKKSLGNSVYSKIDAVISLQEQLKEYERGLKIRQQLLEIEHTKFQSGRISLKDLLNQEEDYVTYQRKVLSCVVNFKLTQAMLQVAIGSILEKYLIDPTQIDYQFHIEATVPGKNGLESKKQ
ncbi:MAG: hypothetical protein SRB1_00611 [Desulfobacteraceae bacterium Eth-SRB1]|nr:MAG: hypothetical protein SRB1_00611 [Desulfobacteraceae bacterium Eth-SRB1]